MKLLLALLLFAGLAAAQTFHSVTLTWTEPAGGATVTSFNVLRGTTSGGESATPIGTVAFVTGQASYTYIDQGSATNLLTEGSTYYYEVTATGPGGTSAPSPEATALIPFSVPAIPSKPTVLVK